MTTVPEAPGRRLPFGLSGSRIELQEYTLVGVVILLLIAGAILEPDVFPTKDNILNVLRQSSVIGVLAIGMTFVIATGRHRPVGRLDGGRGRGRRRAVRRLRAASRSCSAPSAWASCSAASTPA